jgi:hypothetical protein
MGTGIRRAVPPVIATLAAAVVMFALGVGAGPLPALGPALTSARGVWGSAANAALPHSQTLAIPGLAGPSSVDSDTFELQLGLLRTAQAQWAVMPAASPAARRWSPTPRALTT